MKGDKEERERKKEEKGRADEKLIYADEIIYISAATLFHFVCPYKYLFSMKLSRIR